MSRHRDDDKGRPWRQDAKPEPAFRPYDATVDFDAGDFGDTGDVAPDPADYGTDRGIG